MKKLLFFIILISVSSTALCQDYYPVKTHKKIVTDTFYTDYVIEDPYRWMEDVHPEVIAPWLEKHETMSSRYLKIASRKTKARAKIDFYSTVENEFEVKKGDYYFIHAYYHVAGVPALFYRDEDSHKDDYDILIDPNKAFSSKDIRIKGYSLSSDSKYLVYQYGTDGSDWSEARIINMDTESHLPETLTGLRFTNIAWKGYGFYYSTFENTGKYGKAINQKIYYHEAGTPQENDELIFERKNNPDLVLYFSLTQDERFLVIEEDDDKNNRFNYFYIDFESDIKTLRPLLMNMKSSMSIIGSQNGKLIVKTIHQNNNGYVVAIDPKNPYNWEPVISPFPDAINLHSIAFKDRLASIYQVGDHPAVLITDYSGTVLYKLDLPIATSVSGFSGNYDDEEVLLSFESYTIPTITYKLNINTFEKEVKGKTKITFDYEDIIYNEVEVMADDSTMIPVTLVYDKGMELNGKNPLLLEAYGGYGVIASPSFDASVVHFVKSGGIYAYAKIRGGGEKGKEWAAAGKGKNINRTFRDFINVAEGLIRKGYTNPGKLAATGHSHGGLVVSVAAIRRPGLFKAVVPEAAPLDMLRFEKYSIGGFHHDIYGTTTDSTSFTKLLNYSPYHNIKANINYPAMLIVTGENDDRVPPFNSYKFAAALQSRTAQKNPILLNVIKQRGHTSAAKLSERLDERAAKLGFIMYQLGMD